MFQSLIPESHILTAFSTKTETYEDSIKLAKLNRYSQVTLEQTHSSVITNIVKQPKATAHILESDAVITGLKQVNLTVRTADCLPILIFHKKPVIAAIHAGRKGTENNIFKKCLTLIKTEYGISSDLHIWFGPAICKTCYEIDKKSKTHFDLIQENLKQLQEEFCSDNYTLYTSNKCTFEDSSLFYSYRRNKTQERHFSHIVLV
jgi:polyphenol oxidase